MKMERSNSQSTENARTFRATTAQILAALAGTIITINVHAMTTTITIMNGALKEGSHVNSLHSSQNKTAEFSITTAESSFYGTLQLITHFMAGVIGGLIQDICGRRKCLLVSLIPQILSWLVLYFAKNVYWLYIQAVLIGLSTALSEQTITTYLGEISSPSLRGRLFSVSKLGYGFGSCLAYSVSIFLPWRILALGFLFLPTVSLFYVLWLPESPPWLLSKGRTDECRKSLQWIHGWSTDEQIEKEFVKLQNYDKNYKYGKKLTDSESRSQRNTMLHHAYENVKLFSQPEFLRPFKIMSVIFLSSYLLGLRPAKYTILNTLNFLGVPTDKTKDATKIMAVSSIFSIIGSITLAFTIRRFGKRCLILWTFPATAVVLILLGAYSYFCSHHKFSAVWIVYILFGLNFYFGGYTLGGVPWFICSEIFPQKIRGTAVGVTGTFAHILVALLTQSYVFVEEWLTVTNVFFLYAAIGLLCCYYLYKKLPETENKSLQQIEEYFRSKKDKGVTTENTFDNSNNSLLSATSRNKNETGSVL